jgi:hypothetical protein
MATGENNGGSGLLLRGLASNRGVLGDYSGSPFSETVSHRQARVQEKGRAGGFAGTAFRRIWLAWAMELGTLGFQMVKERGAMPGLDSCRLRPKPSRETGIQTTAEGQRSAGCKSARRCS